MEIILLAKNESIAEHLDSRKFSTKTW